MKHLAVFAQGVYRRTNQGIQTTGSSFAQVCALLRYFEEITICARGIDDPEFVGERVDHPDVRFHPLPSYKSRWDLRKVRTYRREMLEVSKAADLTLVVLPGHIGALASWLCRHHELPFFQWVVADWGRVVVARRKRFWGRFSAALLSPFIDRLMRHLTRDTLTFFSGRILYQPHPSFHYTQSSSSLRQKDMLAADRTEDARSVPCRLLYVGRLVRLKGLAHLLDALSLLIRGGRSVTLEIAGIGDLRESLEEKARQMGLEAVVRFHGYVPHGQPLWELFRKCHIFVLPSLEDMHPRVLLEAMSQRLPVVASSVGSIPFLVQHEKNGLLVEPGSPEEIAGAVERLMEAPSLYQRLAREGIRFATDHTIERETERMMGLVGEHFGCSFERRNLHREGS